MANSNLHHDEYILLQVAHGRLKQELATQRLASGRNMKNPQNSIQL